MGKPLRLLFVEDSEDDLALVRREIVRAGYDVTHTRVETASEMRQALLHSRWDVVISDFAMPNFSMPEALQLLHSTGVDLPFIIVSGTIGEETAVAALKSGAHDFMTKDKLVRLVPAIERAMSEAVVRAERRQRERELEAIALLTRALRQVERLADMLPIILDQVLDLLGCDSGALVLRDEATGAGVVMQGRGPAAAYVGHHIPPEEGILGRVLLTGEPYVTANLRDDALMQGLDHYPNLPARPLAMVPLMVQQHVMGVLAVGRDAEIRADEVRLLLSVADIVASSIHRATLFEQTQFRLERLTALRAIDLAINASLDMRVILDVLLAHVLTQLRVDASAVLLLNPLTQTLEFAAGRGFRTSAISRSHVRVGERDAGRAALERRLVSVPDLANADGPLGRREALAAEGFQAYFAVPLIAKGQVNGVLEVFHRGALEADQEWLEFLETLSGQAAIAINNTSLFNGLQRSNADLARAYDATIEGWSRALDLRDRETEGHSQRVTELTLRLALALGVSPSDLVHVRRGALLHDIGKMGVPDAILLKPGPLTDEEWVIMRRHPLLAHELLSPITYLRPALDIPLYHHEKWDGAGYPHGLKGEQIPLTARLFTVADVWDALRSDRPYRKSWPADRTQAYLRDQAGRHFDPAVVETFMRMDLTTQARLDE